MTTALSEAIARQPEVVADIAGRDYPQQVETLAGAGRILLVGTGTSMHAAELGAAMFATAGITAAATSAYQFVHRCWPGRDDDALVVITHTGETAYARRTLQEAAQRGLPVVAITGRGAGIAGAIETVPPERSETYTVSYLAALAVLVRLADGLGVAGTGPAQLLAAAAAVRRVHDDPADVRAVAPPRRSAAIIGAGLGAVTAREGALKLREAGRLIAVGYDPELFLHGSAVPYGPDDALVMIGDDPDGLLDSLVAAAREEGIRAHRLTAAGVGGHPALDQFALTVKLQIMAAAFAAQLGHDPDHVISGAWSADRLWTIGSPTT